MRKLVVPLAAASLIVGMPAIANNQQEEIAEEAEEATASNNIVCRREAAPTGSRIGARNICKTEREWAQIDAEARNTMEDQSTRNWIQGARGPGFPRLDCILGLEC